MRSWGPASLAIVASLAARKEWAPCFFWNSDSCLGRPNSEQGQASQAKKIERGSTWWRFHWVVRKISSLVLNVKWKYMFVSCVNRGVGFSHKSQAMKEIVSDRIYRSLDILSTWVALVTPDELEEPPSWIPIQWGSVFPHFDHFDFSSVLWVSLSIVSCEESRLWMWSNWTRPDTRLPMSRAGGQGQW